MSVVAWGNGMTSWRKRRRAWQPSDNRKLGAGMTFAASARLRYRSARGDQYLTSGRPQSPSPHPAPPANPRLGRPAPLHPGAQGPLSPAGPALPPPLPEAAHSLLLRHLLPSPASFRDYRVRRRRASGASGCFRFPLRAGAGLGLPGRSSALSSRWPESGMTSGTFGRLFPAKPCDDLASGQSGFFRSLGEEGLEETFEIRVTQL